MMGVLIVPTSSDRSMTTHRGADIHTRCDTSCPICRTPIRADEGRPRRVHVIGVASIDALPQEHIVTSDAPKLCAEAGIEHVCASRIEHQPHSLHVCICGARHLEA